ncbi:MAG: lipid-A-disaccharide synthase N-terminal domain-containing protein [Phycisphaerales bacterium]|nr:lipid-A-disaccharide synthase N-terminal domain-containing protein [Phycisphaerales bacterium]
MKWEALLAMLALFLLGAWLVISPANRIGLPEARPGAQIHELRVGPTRGAIEVLTDSANAHSFRLLFRDGTATDPFSDAEFINRFGTDLHDRVTRRPPNWLFRMLNITGWGSLVWIAIGLGGQTLFFGRMAVQWVASERKGESVVPEIFWWLSLGGGIALFAYFVWRQDLVGVMGQTSGVVIYARNIRLIHKKRRREARRAQRELARAARHDALSDPSGEPAEIQRDQPADDAR